MVTSFLYYYGSAQENRGMGGEKSAGMWSDKMVEMVSLYHILYMVKVCLVAIT